MFTLQYIKSKVMIKDINIDDLLDTTLGSQRKISRVSEAHKALRCLEFNIPFATKSKSGELMAIFIPSKGLIMHRNRLLNCDYTNLSKQEFANHVKLGLVASLIEPLSKVQLIKLIVKYNSLSWVNDNLLGTVNSSIYLSTRNQNIE